MFCFIAAKQRFWNYIRIIIKKKGFNFKQFILQKEKEGIELTKCTKIDTGTGKTFHFSFDHLP